MVCGETRRSWQAWLEELHLAVDRSGVIVAHVLTDATTDDALTGITLMKTVNGEVASVNGGSRLRYGRLLRRHGGAWRESRRPTGQDGQGVPSQFRFTQQRPAGRGADVGLQCLTTSTTRCQCRVW